MRNFQLLLPTLSVESLADDFTLAAVARDLNNHANDYVFDTFNLADLLANGEHEIETRDDGIYLVHASNQAVHKLAGYRTYQVRSSNGKLYLTDEMDVYEGYFTGVPAVLLQPEQGARLQG